LVLAALASFVVLVLGAVSQLLSFTIVSAIPTLAAVAALERWTRAPRENAVARAKVISGP